MIKKYPYILLSAVVLLALIALYYWFHPLGTFVEIRGNRFTVELALTVQEQQKGLGYRDTLPEGRGMLFVYQDKNRYGFWMKGMRFPIDILWISDNTIVDITKNAPVSSSGNLQTYTPRAPVNKVLEVNAGTVDKLGIQIGDTIQILKR